MSLVTILGWVLSAVVAFLLGKGGLDKVRGTQEAVGNFAYIKLEKYRTSVGVSEILGVLLLLIPGTSLYGAIVIISLMSGAAALHLSLMNGAKTWFPILVGAIAVLSHILRVYQP